MSYYIVAKQTFLIRRNNFIVLFHEHLEGYMMVPIFMRYYSQEEEELHLQIYQIFKFQS